MSLSAKQRGETVATFRFIQVHLMETLAAWVPTTPEMEAKLLFGAHIWDVAQHADAFGRRTFELRLPLQFSLRPATAYVDVLTRLSALADTTQRIAGFYDVMLPALGKRFRDYLDRVDTLMDAPTVRIIERVLADESRMIRESQELRDQLPEFRLADAGWIAMFSDSEAAVREPVVPRTTEPLAHGR